MVFELFEKKRYQTDIELDKAAFQNWIKSANDMPDADRTHALKMMSTALREELTEKQRQYITAYYVNGKSMPEIGEMYGVNKSTVSRTISRSLRKIKKFCDTAVQFS